jgi:hypothetical protein
MGGAIQGKVYEKYSVIIVTYFWRPWSYLFPSSAPRFAWASSAFVNAEKRERERERERERTGGTRKSRSYTRVMTVQYSVSFFSVTMGENKTVS